MAPNCTAVRTSAACLTPAEFVPYRMPVSVDRETPGRSSAAAWQRMAEAIEALPEAEQIGPRLNLARLLRNANQPEAGVQAFAGWKLARRFGDAAAETQARKLVRRCVPGYHAQVATDPVRLAAWEAALAATIRPDMRVLEIGAGCGILAMLAARCGAAFVTGCERDPTLAAMAEEIVARNGLADRISIVAKSIHELQLPGDLDEAADLLLLDLFADNLFAMAPFGRVREAMPLLKRGAVVVPRRAVLVGALAFSSDRRRTAPEVAAGFDITPLAAAAPLQEIFRLSDVNRLCGPERVLVEANLPDAMPEDAGETTLSLTSNGGPVNAIVTWLGLELAEGHWIEARPQAHSSFYAQPRCYPLAREWESEAGEQIPIRLTWRGDSLSVGLSPEPSRFRESGEAKSDGTPLSPLPESPTA